MSKVGDIRGEKFSRLTALSRAGTSPRGKATWNCVCDCGANIVVAGADLRNGNTTSCGCKRKTANGESSNKTPEYTTWEGMIARCENKKNIAYHNYGGRGIKICARWRSSFADFISDVGRKPTSSHSIDRINNDGDYEPGNVRWATSAEQNANKRKKQRRNWREAANHAYAVVRSFEDVIASYTGAPYAVSVESCTSAILLCCAHLKVKEVEIPRFTYCGVPMSVMHAGGRVRFRDESWKGMYKLEPYPIYDSARLFTSGMYIQGSLMCLSFHWAKHLPIGRGGAILCEDRKSAEWFRRARFDGRQEGRSPKNDKGLILGWHMYLTPPAAAQGLMLMASISEHNEPLENSDYPDLSLLDIFK